MSAHLLSGCSRAISPESAVMTGVRATRRVKYCDVIVAPGHVGARLLRVCGENARPSGVSIALKLPVSEARSQVRGWGSEWGGGKRC